VAESGGRERNKGVFSFTRDRLLAGVLSHDYSTIIVQAKLIY
jgi:hypothetical protein